MGTPIASVKNATCPTPRAWPSARPIQANRSPIARSRNALHQRRRRCSAASWIMWHRWHSAARLRGRLSPGSWFRWALARTTRVTSSRGGASMPARASWSTASASGPGRERTRFPRPLRQVAASRSHQIPSPRCNTSQPWGRRHRAILNHRSPERKGKKRMPTLSRPIHGPTTLRPFDRRDGLTVSSACFA